MSENDRGVLDEYEATFPDDTGFGLADLLTQLTATARLEVQLAVSQLNLRRVCARALQLHQDHEDLVNLIGYRQPDAEPPDELEGFGDG